MAKAAESALKVTNTGPNRVGFGPGPKYEIVDGKQRLRANRTPGVAFFDSKHDDNIDVQAKAAGIPVKRFGRHHVLKGDHAATLRNLPKALTDRLGLDITEA